MPKTVLFVGENPPILEGIRRLCEPKGVLVSQARSISEATIFSVRIRPVVAIVDVPLHVAEIESIARMQREAKAPVLVLAQSSAYADELHRRLNGSHDVVLKPTTAVDILQAASALVKRVNRTNEPEPCVEAGPIRVDANAKLAVINGQNVELTATEFKVLHFLTAHPGKAVSRKRLFESAWGYEIDHNSNSLEVIVYRLRAKIREAGAPEMLRTVRGIGYRLEV